MSGTRKTLHVDGISCASCEKRIETALTAIPGVHRASAAAPLSEVAVEYNPAAVSEETIAQAIRDAGYEVPPRQNTAGRVQRPRGRSRRHLPPLARFLGLAALIAGFAVFLRSFVGFSFLPSVSQEMAYGMLFVVGLITSLHCVAMCGGIAITQAVGRGCPGERKGLLPSLLYNAGRVTSYTIIGAIAGSVGSLVSLSSSLKGIVPVLAGAFMLFLGIRMLGIFPWLSRVRVRFPALLPPAAQRRLQGAGPFAVGLLNGLMPCGPLQTMQVYALGTGSLLAGAFSMLVFSAATVPLVLGFGAASALLSGGFTKRLFKLSGVLVLALGAVMLARGAGLLGWLPGSPQGKTTAWISAPRRGDGGQVPTREVGIARIVEGIQVVEVRADAGGYHPAVLVLQNGIPARIRFLPGRLDAITSTVSFPGYTADLDLGAGPTEAVFDNVVADFTFRCGTDVLHGYVKVVDDLRRVDLAAVRRQVASYRPAGAALASCCGY